MTRPHSGLLGPFKPHSRSGFLGAFLPQPQIGAEKLLFPHEADWVRRIADCSNADRVIWTSGAMIAQWGIGTVPGSMHMRARSATLQVEAR